MQQPKHFLNSSQDPSYAAQNIVNAKVINADIKLFLWEVKPEINFLEKIISELDRQLSQQLSTLVSKPS